MAFEVLESVLHCTNIHRGDGGSSIALQIGNVSRDGALSYCSYSLPGTAHGVCFIELS